jgi:hypothetical protein
MHADNTVDYKRTALVAWAQRLAGSLEAEADYTAAGTWAASRSECATVHRARKRLRTCDELWPDNKPAWCEQCARRKSAGRGHDSQAR